MSSNTLKTVVTAKPEAKRSTPTVVTAVPDSLYNELLQEVNQSPNKRITTKFDGDKEKTKIWLEASGKLMSRMPSEVYMKEIRPMSGMEQLTALNGRGDFLQRLLARGMPNDKAVHLSQLVYKVVPMHTILTDDIIEQLERGFDDNNALLVTQTSSK